MHMFFKAIVGIIVGGVLGIAAGVVFILAVAEFAKWQSPQDPTAGAIAIMVLYTGPFGGVLGAGIGASVATRRPRGKPGNAIARALRKEYRNMNHVSSRHRPPLVQSIVYIALRVFALVGGLIAICFFTPGITVFWIFSLGIASAIAVRLPARWFFVARFDE